jgi:hypothetical protein
MEKKFIRVDEVAKELEIWSRKTTVSAVDFAPMRM